MGIDARLVVYASSKTVAENACIAAFAKMAELDAMMSDYRKDSELMLLCDRPAGSEVKVSSELFTVLERAQEVSERTAGAFDVTIGPLVRMWRKARKAKVLPTQAEIAEARALVGWKKMTLNRQDRTVKLALSGMKLDLGGIAKGYAGDEAQKVLKKFGIKCALVEMGGDIVVTAPPPGTKGWKIKVPNADGQPEMTFSNCAVSTSGDTEQSTLIDGKRYSHVVDPRTGVALTNRVQITLIAKDGLTSDPVSTALSLVSEAERTKLILSYPGTRGYVKILPFLASAS